MGWLFTQGQTKEALVARKIQPWGNDSEDKDGNKIHVSGKCLAHAVRGNTLFTVFEVTSGKEVSRFIGVDLLKSHRGYGWGIKEQEESCGPYQHDCPLYFFDLVPEPPNEYARAWRERVKAAVAARKANTNKRKAIKVGDTVILVPGCTIPQLKVTRVTPKLVGVYGGLAYRIAPRFIQEVVGG